MLNKLLNFFKGHITWGTDSATNIGVDARTTNNAGDGQRPRNVFAGGLIASGNLYNLNAPYGLNGPASIVGGIFAAGNGGATSVAFMASNGLLNGTLQGLHGFSKDTGSNNVPGWYNNDLNTDYDIYYSLGHRTLAREDIFKLAYTGSLSLLKTTGANIIWGSNGTASIGSADSGVTFAAPQNIYLNGYVGFAQIATPTAPGAGKNWLYFKSDGSLRTLNAAGLESTLVSQDMYLDLVAQTTSIPTATFLSPTADTLYSVSIYVNVTTGATAGTLDVTITWADDSGTQTSTVVSGLSLITSGAYSQATLVLKAKSGQPVQYSTTLTGVVGSPQYTLVIAGEKLGQG